MSDETKRIIHALAAKYHKTPTEVEDEMKAAIREAMKTKDPKAQALWHQMVPDGKEPELDTFLAFMSLRVNAIVSQKKNKF